MVCTGAKSEEDSRFAARKYARIVQKLGFPAKFKDFKIQNMVGSCDVKFPIRLEGLVLTHSQFTSYEPELFPGKNIVPIMSCCMVSIVRHLSNNLEIQYKQLFDLFTYLCFSE